MSVNVWFNCFNFLLQKNIPWKNKGQKKRTKKQLNYKAFKMNSIIQIERNVG